MNPTEEQENASYLLAEACINLRQLTAVVIAMSSKDDKSAQNRVKDMAMASFLKLEEAT